MNDIIVIVIIAIIVIYVMYDRRTFEEKMFKQLDDAIKGIKARDLTEYMAAKETDEVKKQPFSKPTEEVEVGEASDEEFDKFIKTQ